MKVFTIAVMAATIAAAPLAGQTPARAGQPVRARPAAPAIPDSQDKFAAIRNRYDKELASERAALQKTHDRMREELVAAGWRPRRMAQSGMMRARMAAFRAPQARMARGGQ